MPKMAQRPPKSIAFLRDLAARAKPFAQRDYAELAAFARDRSASPTLAPWDLAYASERLKADRYAYTEQEVRQYFPEDQVLAGLFRVVETIYGVHIRETRAPMWHPTVRFFDIRDAQRRAGRRVLFRPLRARGQAGRRVDGRRDQPPPRRRTRCSIRSPT